MFLLLFDVNLFHVNLYIMSYNYKIYYLIEFQLDVYNFQHQ